MHFKPGSQSDLNVLWNMELDIPIGSELYADGACNCFDLEDIFEEERIKLLTKRGSAAANRLRSDFEEKTISSRRQIVETAFSCITVAMLISRRRPSKEFSLKRANAPV